MAEPIRLSAGPLRAAATAVASTVASRTQAASTSTGYGPSRAMYDGGFSTTFHADAELLLSLGWAAGLGLALAVLLRRAVGCGHLMSDTVHHPIFARLYSWLSPKAEGKGVADHRRETLAGLAGRVLELGAGNGLNFQHYPTTVDEVVAVEPEAYLRARAQAAATTAPIPITVLDAVADHLPFPDESFDAIVASLVLCSVPDQVTALAELRRVLRQGGELRFYEHVRPGNPRTAALWQRADDSGIYPRLSGGCHAARDTEAAIGAAGFTIERCRRFNFKGGPVTAPHIIGVARRSP